MGRKFFLSLLSVHGLWESVGLLGSRIQHNKIADHSLLGSESWSFWWYRASDLLISLGSSCSIQSSRVSQFVYSRLSWWERIRSSKGLQAGSQAIWTGLCELDLLSGLARNCLCGQFDGKMHLHESVGKFHGFIQIFHSSLGWGLNF